MHDCNKSTTTYQSFVRLAFKRIFISCCHFKGLTGLARMGLDGVSLKDMGWKLVVVGYSWVLAYIIDNRVEDLAE